MYQFIAAVVGLFSSKANLDKASYANAMAHYAAEEERIARNEKIFKSMEIIIPGLMIVLIVVFYYKVAKKWL